MLYGDGRRQQAGLGPLDWGCDVMTSKCRDFQKELGSQPQMELLLLGQGNPSVYIDAIDL